MQSKSLGTSSIGQRRPKGDSGSSDAFEPQFLVRYGVNTLEGRQASALPVTAVGDDHHGKLELPHPIDAMLAPRITLPGPGKDPRLQLKQLWEGTVTEVLTGGFVAVLSDKTDPMNPDEKGEFSFEDAEISADDRELIEPGSSFYWAIGTLQSPGGTVQNVASLQFRRHPFWTKRTIARAEKKAETLLGLLRERP
jgi:hypothetical protein